MKKRILNILFIALLFVTITGCGKKQETNLNLSLEEIIAKVYDGIEDMPNVDNIEINEENLSYFLGIEKLDYKEALASEPLISSIPHSVVVVRVKDGVDIKKTMEEIRDKVNPAKWICVEAENVIVDNIGDVIILIMSNENADAMANNFRNLK